MNNFKKLIMTLWFPIIASNFHNGNSPSVTNLMEKMVNIKGEIKDEYFDVSPKDVGKPNFNEDKELHMEPKLGTSNLKTVKIGQVSRKKSKQGKLSNKSHLRERKFKVAKSRNKNYYKLNNNENLSNEGDVIKKKKVGRNGYKNDVSKSNISGDLSDNNISSSKKIKVGKEVYNTDLIKDTYFKISGNDTRKTPKFSFSDSNKDISLQMKAKNEAEMPQHVIISNNDKLYPTKYQVMKIGEPSKVDYFTCHINREGKERIERKVMDRISVVTDVQVAELRHALSQYKEEARLEDDDDSNTYDSGYFAYEVSTTLKPAITNLYQPISPSSISKSATSLTFPKQKTMVPNTSPTTSNVTKQKIVVLSDRSVSQTTLRVTRPTVIIFNSKNATILNATTKCTKATHSKCTKTTPPKSTQPKTTKCPTPPTTTKHPKPPTTKCLKPTTKSPKPTTKSPKPTTKCPKPTTKSPKPTTKCPKPTTKSPKPTTHKIICTKLITTKCPKSTTSKCKVNSKYRGTKRSRWLLYTKARNNDDIKSENGATLKHGSRGKHATLAPGCNKKEITTLSDLSPLNALEVQLGKKLPVYISNYKNYQYFKNMMIPLLNESVKQNEYKELLFPVQSSSDGKRNTKEDNEMRKPIKRINVGNNKYEDEFNMENRIYVNRPQYNFRNGKVNTLVKNKIRKRTNKDSEIRLEFNREHKGNKLLDDISFVNKNNKYINKAATQKFKPKTKFISDTNFKLYNRDEFNLENVTNNYEPQTFENQSSYDNFDLITSSTTHSLKINRKKPNFQLLNITQVFNMYSKLLPVKKYLETLHKNHLVRNYFQNDIDHVDSIEGEPKSNYNKIIEIIANNEWPQTDFKNKEMSTKDLENRDQNENVEPTANYQQIEEYFRTLPNNEPSTNDDLQQKDQNENIAPGEYFRTLPNDEKSTNDIENNKDQNENIEPTVNYQQIKEYFKTLSNNKQNTNELESYSVLTLTTQPSLNYKQQNIDDEENIKRYNLIKEKLKISLKNLTNANRLNSNFKEKEFMNSTIPSYYPALRRKLYQSIMMGPHLIKDRANFKNKYRSKNRKGDLKLADIRALVTLKDMLRNNLNGYDKTKCIDEDSGKLKYKYRWNYRCKYR